MQAFKDTINSLPEDSDMRQRGEALVKPLPNLPLGGAEKDTPSTTPSHSPQTKPVSGLL